MQWIVADGASSDGTLEVIQRNADIINRWFSEPDAGIYDAWNKACRFIDGEWVLFLGAGDRLCEPQTLTDVGEVLARLSAATRIVYGNVVQRSKGTVAYRYEEVDLCEWQHFRPALPPHQGTFHRADLLLGSTPFDTGYKIVGDSKLLLQVVRPATTHYLGFDVAEMDEGGISAHPAYSIAAMKELLRLEKDVGYRIPFLRKAWFIVRSRVKFVTYRLAGAGTVSLVARMKRRIRLSRE